MFYAGDFRTGKTVRGMWASNAIAGESITRATNGTVSVYKDGNTTQSTAGVTDTEDFDSLTGVHYVAIDTSADGTFYSAGSDFAVVLSGATIDGKTINAFLFSFSLENRSPLMPTTDGRKLDVSAGGEAGVDWANVGSPTTTVGLSGTTVKTATDVEADTADIQGRLPAALVSGRIDASVGAMAANVMTAAAAAADLTTELQSGLATAASIAALNNLSAAQVNAEVDTALADYDGPTHAELTSGLASADDAVLAAIAALNNLSQANIRTAIGLASANLDTQIADLPTNAELATALGTADDAILAAIAALNNLSAAQVNAEVDTALNDYDGPTNTELTAALAAADDAVLAAIAALNNLSSAAAQSAAAAALTAYDPPTHAELTSGLAAADDAVLAAIAALNNLSQANVRTALGLATANLDDQLTAIDDLIDAEVAAIKVVTDRINTAMELDGAVYRFTTNALEQAPAGGGGGGGGDATEANQLLILDQLDVIQARTDMIALDSEINILPVVVGTTMNIVRGCTLTANFSALGALTGRDYLYITVKRDVEDADTEAVFKIEETAGLQVLNGSYYDPAAGTIVVTNAATGALTVTLSAAAAKLLNTSRRLYYDMKMVDGAVVTQLISGYATVTGDVTRLD